MTSYPNPISHPTKYLEETQALLESRALGIEMAPYREWQTRLQELAEINEELTAVRIELAKRGASGDDATKDLIKDLHHARHIVTTRGFTFDRRIVTRLVELLAFRKVIRRQALTGDDLEREWALYLRNCPTAATTADYARHAFEVGLVRGFEIRAENAENI